MTIEGVTTTIDGKDFVQTLFQRLGLTDMMHLDFRAQQDIELFLASAEVTTRMEEYLEQGEVFYTSNLAGYLKARGVFTGEMSKYMTLNGKIYEMTGYAVIANVGDAKDPWFDVLVAVVGDDNEPDFWYLNDKEVEVYFV